VNCAGRLMWAGEWGEYEIPPALAQGVRFRVNGWPDKRWKQGYAALMEWVKKQEAAKREAWERRE